MTRSRTLGALGTRFPETQYPRARLRVMEVRALAALAARVVGGGVFVVFGLGKFVNHASEVDSFRDYGLPAPAAFVDMIGAIVVSGLALGEPISLTLAPAELVLCLFLFWKGPGAYALDTRLSGSR